MPLPGKGLMESAASSLESSSSPCSRSGNLAIRALMAERYRSDMPGRPFAFFVEALAPEVNVSMLT